MRLQKDKEKKEQKVAIVTGSGIGREIALPKITTAITTPITPATTGINIFKLPPGFLISWV